MSETISPPPSVDDGRIKRNLNELADEITLDLISHFYITAYGDGTNTRREVATRIKHVILGTPAGQFELPKCERTNIDVAMGLMKAEIDRLSNKVDELECEIYRY